MLKNKEGGMKVLSILWVLCLSAFFIVKVDCAPYEDRFEGEFKEFGENRLALVAKFIPENPVIFEAGGHYGKDTVRFIEQWPKSNIISFEPNPNAFKNLKSNTMEFENVYAYNIAVNGYNGTALLNVCYGTTGEDPIFEGASSLLEASEGMKIHYGGPKVEVPCVILDDWCGNNSVDHIDFMWLDLEGLELQILASSPRILDTVKVIYTETNFFEFRKGTTQFSELKAFLEKSGFKMLSHWYKEGLQGDAIFVKSEISP
jgi:2-O-methyltransferase